ncbi:MAG: 2-oxoacid:acceptor oxidoreductase family protein [Candidatus Eremiobacterota bacterium]
MKIFNIYLIGVGGQGIGLLSEVIIRACDYAGYPVRGVDTHGLAQRGGTVISHIRIGQGVYSPLIQVHMADLVVALERNEALRGLNEYLKDGGTLVYYDALWQPLSVRLGKSKKLEGQIISDRCNPRNIREIKVFRDELEDSRMQNMEVLSDMAKLQLIPYVDRVHYDEALKDLMAGKVLEKNLHLLGC